MNTRTTFETGKGSAADSRQDPARADRGANLRGCCDIDIHIDSRGDVNIYNCPTQAGGGEALPPPTCPPGAPPGTCIPVVAGAKHKRSRDQKLTELAGRARVPSSLAAATLHMSRRFLLGKPAANPLESAAFAVLGRLSPALRDTLSCTVAAYDALPPRQRSPLFEPSLAFDPDHPIDGATLSTAWGKEIVKRAGVVVFDDPQAPDQERPGLIRVYRPEGEDFFSQVRICRVNDLRTANYFPPLNPGDYLPAEIQQDCAPTLVNGQPQVVCQVRTTDCPGNFTGGFCARVPEVAAGDGVVLQGVNFFSVDAKVRLNARPPGTATRDVDAHVWGDVETPATEVVNGATVLINDCRVHDRITFRVPEDLPPAIYQIQVIVPNITGIDSFGDTLASNAEFLNVTVPPAARFQIVGETIYARKETSPDWLGSDEVGLRTIAVPWLLDGTFGDMQTQDFKDIQNIDFDTGVLRNVTRNLFSQQQPVLGVALSVLGHEIDSQRAYDEMITSFTDIFIDLLKKEADFIKGSLAALGGAAALGKLGPVGWIAAGVAAAVTLAVDVVVALWAPADLIIEDSLGFSTADLVALTSPNFPAPQEGPYTTERGIEVKTTPLDKIPLQYRERREYISAEEDSRYEIVYRWNRVA